MFLLISLAILFVIALATIYYFCRTPTPQNENKGKQEQQFLEASEEESKNSKSDDSLETGTPDPDSVIPLNERILSEPLKLGGYSSSLASEPLLTRRNPRSSIPNTPPNRDSLTAVQNLSPISPNLKKGKADKFTFEKSESLKSTSNSVPGTPGGEDNEIYTPDEIGGRVSVKNLALNLKINPLALLPGTRPISRTTAGRTGSASSPPRDDPEIIQEENSENSELSSGLLKNVSKDRVKIVKPRRPPTRKPRSQIVSVNTGMEFNFANQNGFEE